MEHTGRAVSRGLRQRGGKKLPGKLPSLQEFVHKQNVIRQYRHFLKAVCIIEDQGQKLQALQEVKSNFPKAFHGN